MIKIYSFLLLVALSLCTCIDSVVQPPRILSHIAGHDQINTDSRSLYEIEAAELLILGEDTKELLLDESSSLTLRLTRPVSVPVDVTVTIKSERVLEFVANNGTTSNTIQVTFPANEISDIEIKYRSNKTPGHAEIICEVDKQPAGDHVDYHLAFVSVDVGRSQFIWSFMQILGWLYFAAWSISFYPQIILNYRRKSVVGLNFDFIALNLIGFTMYSIFNISLLYSRTVQENYYEKYAYSRIPVEYNDLFFSVHAATLTLVTIVQCFIYERGDQKVSLPSTIFSIGTILVGFVLFVTSLFSYVTPLNVVFYFSYVKLAITLIKYIPQAYMNYQRKSTVGWSIHNIMLDSTGGILSLGQMMLAAYNYNDWILIFGNPTKFGLGVFSISFDVLFFLQHYVFYKHRNGSQFDINPEINHSGGRRD